MFMILRRMRQRLEGRGQLEYRFEARMLTLPQQTLSHAQGMGRIDGDALGEYDGADEPAREGRLSIDRLPGKCHLGGLRQPHDARQQKRAAVARNDPELDEALRKARAL